MKFDALVLGGGPAGATAALILARAGWSVAVVEKAEFPRRKVCGEFISATSLPLLHEIGVGTEFFARAGPEVRRVGLYADDAVVTAPMPRAASLRGRWGRALGREHLDLILMDAAARAGAKLWQPWSATGLRRDGREYVCTVATKDAQAELAASIVIAAHGSWERAPLSPQVAHGASDLLAFKAHFRDSDLPADLMPLLVFPGGYGGMVSSDSGRVTLSCCIRRDALERCRERHPGPAAEAVFAHIQASCAGVRLALGRARRDGAWLAAGPIRPGIRARYRDGIFRAGNLAGEAHPIIAEGISMAMQSAWLLARRLIAHEDDLAAGRAHAAIGHAYATEWADHFGARIRAAAAFAHVAMRPRAAAPLVPIVQRFPALLTFGARLSGKTVVPAA